MVNRKKNSLFNKSKLWYTLLTSDKNILPNRYTPPPNPAYESRRSRFASPQLRRWRWTSERDEGFRRLENGEGATVGIVNTVEVYEGSVRHGKATAWHDVDVFNPVAVHVDLGKVTRGGGGEGSYGTVGSGEE